MAFMASLGRDRQIHPRIHKQSCDAQGPRTAFDRSTNCFAVPVAAGRARALPHPSTAKPDIFPSSRENFSPQIQMFA
jgi:hypothetical protein